MQFEIYIGSDTRTIIVPAKQTQVTCSSIFLNHHYLHYILTRISSLRLKDSSWISNKQGVRLARIFLPSYVRFSLNSYTLEEKISKTKISNGSPGPVHPVDCDSPIVFLKTVKLLQELHCF